MRYPVHVGLLGLWLAGIVATSVYDDLIYPIDDGLISIGIVFLFAATLVDLVRRVRRDEVRRKAAPRPGAAPPGGA